MPSSKERHAIYARQHYIDNKQKYLERTQSAAAAIIQIIRNAKSVPCTDCGVTYPYYVMDFDHRDSNQKSFTIGGSTRRRGRLQLLAEIAKCDVVCSNCHRERTQHQVLARVAQ